MSRSRTAAFGVHLPRLPNLTTALVWTGIVVLALTFYLPYWTAERVARAENRSLLAARNLLELAIDERPDLAQRAEREAMLAALQDWSRRIGLPSTWYPEAVELRQDDEPEGLTVRMKHYYLRLTRTPADRLPTPPTPARLPEQDSEGSDRSWDTRSDATDLEDFAVALHRAWTEHAPGPASLGAGVAEAVRAALPEQTSGSDESGKRSTPENGRDPIDGTDADPVADDTGAPTNPLAVDAADLPFEVHAWPAGNLGAGYTAFYVPERGIAAYTRNKSAKYQGTRRAPRAGDGQPRASGAKKNESDRSYRSANDERWIPLPPPETR
jgi:hypothetical protein